MSDNVMNGPDLNRIRQTVLENQAHGNTRPKDPNKQITADREGGLHIGPVTTGQAVSVVPQETFASRLDEDRRTASEKLPTNTTEVTTREGVTGFLYRINSSFGYKFEMFAYYDGSQYQVMVIEPEIEAHWRSPHTGHIFGNGQICFGDRYGHGMPTLQDAFAKSALWAEGMSVALNTGQFPYSENNL